LIKCFAPFYQRLINFGEEVDWFKVTQADFDTFRTSPFIQPSIHLSSPSPSAPSSASFPPKPAQLSPAALFHCGIKKDSNVFPTLEDEKFHDTWHRSFINRARAQDVSDFLDDSYVPVTAEEIELFEDKAQGVSDVLDKTYVPITAEEIEIF
jgi:hypothetical protein